MVKEEGHCPLSTVLMTHSRSDITVLYIFSLTVRTDHLPPLDAGVRPVIWTSTVYEILNRSPDGIQVFGRPARNPFWSL